ncbi:MAG: hypothetical protein E6I23_08500 [Chloroflexi bacterium]|nr:MAG: hypothetical protein E6I23_08500 [Chloroflexota bacterium]
MLRGRASVALGMIFIAVVALLAWHLFGTSWSNHCDPGNKQFDLLRSDPVVSSHFSGELFVWENDGPDNSWLCSNPTLSVSHIGDASTLFPGVKADMVDGHWTKLAPMPNENFAVYQKDTPTGIRLTAVVRSQPFWVEVDLDAPGLHPGESGFQ